MFIYLENFLFVFNILMVSQMHSFALSQSVFYPSVALSPHINNLLMIEDLIS